MINLYRIVSQSLVIASGTIIALGLSYYIVCNIIENSRSASDDINMARKTSFASKQKNGEENIIHSIGDY